MVLFIPLACSVSRAHPEKRSFVKTQMCADFSLFKMMAMNQDKFNVQSSGTLVLPTACKANVAEK